LMTIGGVIAIIAIASSRHPEEAVFGLIYIVLGLLYLAPGVYLGRYAARISDTINMRREDSLEKAIEAQKSFWKFVGILFLLMIGLWVLGIVIAIIVAILN
jgi:divalent metal cation (Fe/Co/Zn/Cd) transporter